MTRKWKSPRGETFIEVLASMLVITLGMFLLQGAIVVSARVNNRAAASENVRITLPVPERTRSPEYANVVITNGNPSMSMTVPVKVYYADEGGAENENVLRYYEKADS